MQSYTDAAILVFSRRLASRSTLTSKELSAILELSGEVKMLNKHHDFAHPGDTLNHSYLVVEGLVGRFGETRYGSRQIASLHIPGDVVDLSSMVSPRCSLGLVTLSRTTIMLLPHAKLRRLAARHPGIAEAFWRECIVQGSIFSQWVVNVGRRDAPSRVSHLFCEMGIRCELAGQGDRHSFPLPVCQTSLGDAVGLTNVHVNRTLMALKTQGILTMHSGRVVVHDWDRLASIADFNTAFLLLHGPLPRITSDAGAGNVHFEDLARQARPLAAT